jgi:DNA polymerase-3 subunit delta
MQLKPEQLAAHLQKGLRPLYTVHGDEPLLAQEALDAIRARARELGYAERTVHTVAGAHFDWGAVLAAGQSLSLFADKQIVEVRIPGGKPGKEGSAALQQLAAQAAQNPEAGTLWLVALPKLDRAARDAAWFTALEAAGVALAVEPVERAALPRWIAQRLARQQQSVADGEDGVRALQFFADRVEGNLLAAHQEISKLGLLYPAGALTFEQIEAAVLNVARYNVYKLPEAMLAGRRERVQRMLDGLEAEGEPEVRVHYAIAEEIRALKRVKDQMAAGDPLPVALRAQRIWGQRERLFERVLPRLPELTLAQLLHAAQQADGIVKGLSAPGWPRAPWQALHRLAQSLTSACAAGKS